MKSRRLVVKVGSSSLTDAEGLISIDKMTRLVDQIAHLQRTEGCRMILVSSGAVASGIGKLGLRRSTVTMPEKQAAAAIGQGLLIQRYEQLFAEHSIGIAQLLLTRADIEDRNRFIRIRNTIETLLRFGIIPIINENDTVAVEEIQFGDNDTLGSLVALVAEAEQLVLLTDIEGLYTANPRQDPTAELIPEVWKITDELEQMAGGHGSAVGTGGMRTKISAAKIAVQSGVSVVVASSAAPDVLARIVKGERVGTLFHALPNPLPGKKSWIAHGSRAEGTLRIDQGAVHALVDQAGSLLLPGVVSVEGDFQEGDIVELADLDGMGVGKGVVNFSCWDLRLLLEQRKASEKAQVLQEIVHRNEMVIFKRGD